jgi:hypothetical protein
MKKKVILRRSAMVVAVSTVFFLTACGGGGGGGSGGGNSYVKPDEPVYSSGTLSNYGFTPGSRSTVPYATPTLVSTFNPYGNTNSYASNNSQQYVVNNLTGDGGDDMIVAGRRARPQGTVDSANWVNTSIQIFDWVGGKFTNDTAKWFSGNSNSILGTDPTIQFADFFHSGRKDMFVSPSTDSNYYGPNGNSVAWYYRNTGSSFQLTTVDLGTQVWGHGATIGDLDRSGYQSVVIADVGANTTLLLNDHTTGFRVYQDWQGANGQLRFGGSSVATADFLGTGGNQQLVFTDTACSGGAVGCDNTSSTKLYTWNIDSATNQLSFNFVKNLPTPIFDQAQYAYTGGAHNYLVITNDFSAPGSKDIMVFSSPNKNQKLSAIQLLQNDGAGNFTDVTLTMLKGYNMNTYGTYQPQFIDLGNGQKSMIVSEGGDIVTANNNTQFLIKQSATGPYVAAFQNLISDFSSQANMIAGAQNGQNTVAVVKDPSNNLYLATTVQYTVNNQLRMSTYLSLIGGSVDTITAQTAFNQVKAVWPWMSPAQVNSVLAATSSSYMTDAGAGLVLNPDKLLNPVGALSIATRSGAMNLSGGIAGVNLGAMSQAQAVDSLGRNFVVNFGSNNYTGPNSFATNTEHVDQYNMTSHTEYLLNGNTNTVYSPLGAMRLGFENRNQWNTVGAPTPPKEFGDNSGNQGFYVGMTQPKQWSFGIPEIYRNGYFSTGMQYTSLNTNPWMNFTGAFGSVSSSGTLEHVATYARNGFSVQGAVMRTTTNFRPGMVTDVAPITAAWGETGYRYTEDRFGDLGVYLGVKPVVLNGSVTATMPTGVDNAGNTVYTTTKMGIVSQTTPYVRALYTGTIDRNSGYRLSGMTTRDGQYRAMAEYRYTFN